MPHQSKPPPDAILPTQVWACLCAERRRKAIQFMAELAFNLLKMQSAESTLEVTHVNRTNTQQDSSRPS
ncbi:hypothetical protein KFU94_35900 [Chloroflexi bacterium TSY]|nr:hypothetical protein [Chloroflexi bacterium TSY]